MSSCVEYILDASDEIDNQIQKGNSAETSKLLNALNTALNFMIEFDEYDYDNKGARNAYGYKEVPYTRVYAPYASYKDYKEAQIPKTNNTALGIWTGLAYVQKGFSASSFDNTTTKAHLNYLEVPVYAMAKHKLESTGGSIFAGIGPYFGYGVGGNIKGGGFSTPSFGENNGGYKRFDAGLGILGGYQFDFGLSIHLSYELGLTNIAYPSSDITAKNRAFSINVGYSLKKLFNGMK
jgi:hypothetical protein